MKRPERSQLEGDTGGMTIARPIRDRSWDQEHNKKQVLTFRLNPDEKAKIIQITATEGITRANLLEVFIRYAMKAYDGGQLKIKKEVAGYTGHLNGDS